MTKLPPSIRYQDTTSFYLGGWLVTFCDILTLLLTFFVMRLSMTSLQTEELQNRIRPLNLSNIVASSKTDKKSGLSSQPTESQLPTSKDEDTESLVYAIKSALGLFTPDLAPQISGAISSKATVTSSGTRTIITIGNSPFVQGTKLLSFSAQEILSTIYRMVREKKLLVRIICSTDPNEMTEVVSPLSPWDLSVLRAKTLIQQMIESGIPPSSITASTNVSLIKPDDDPKNHSPRSSSLEIILTTPNPDDLSVF